MADSPGFNSDNLIEQYFESANIRKNSLKKKIIAPFIYNQSNQQHFLTHRNFLVLLFYN